MMTDYVSYLKISDNADIGYQVYLLQKSSVYYSTQNNLKHMG